MPSAPWRSYAYDANGNQPSRPGGEAVTYTAFNLPKTMTGPQTASFEYEASGVRAKKQKDSSNFTVYMGRYYEKRVAGSSTDHIFYVMGPSGPVAQVTRHQGGSTDTVRYVHADRLSSVDAVTDANGTVSER